jgi:hypothetical protein
MPPFWELEVGSWALTPLEAEQELFVQERRRVVLL